MAKRRNEEELAQSYQAFLKLLPEFDSTASVNDQVKAIILYADKLQTEICEKADYIKIDAYKTIAENWPELGIPKTVWLELVHLRRLQRHTNLSDELIAKIGESFEGAKNVTALRKTMLEAIKDNKLETAQVPTCETTKELAFENSETLDEKFIELLNECADTRNYIDTELWTKIRIAGNAFSYVTKEPYKVFKELLDLWHYRNGGWPKANTPPRVWKIIMSFIHTYDQLERYGFDMASSWCSRLGLKTQRTPMSPTAFTFTRQGEKFGQYFMAKLKPDTEMKYPQYAFKPWHHLIAKGDTFFAYVWDTREIQFSGNFRDIDPADLTTDYQDSCEPLTGDIEILKLAKTIIPDAISETENFEVDEPVKPEEPKVLPVGTGIGDGNYSARAKERLETLEPEVREVIENTDPILLFEKQQDEVGMPDDIKKLSVWRQMDIGYNEYLGTGVVLGQSIESGKLIVEFYQHKGQNFEVWPWNLLKPVNQI